MTKAAQAYTRHLQPGQRFGRLTAVTPAGHEAFGRRPKALWRFRCDCGTELVTRSESVKSGNTQSCGCQKKDNARSLGRANKKHGLEGTRIYRIWGAMIGRCENPDHFRFEYYGALGIKVCGDWHDVHRFREWA